MVYPSKHPVHIYAAMPIAKDQELREYVSQWILLKKQQGAIQRLVDYWIYGKAAEGRKKRWSIIRDVLHWVED